MHVGLITACYEPVTNGVTRMVSLYRSGLEELGHRVTIFTLGRMSTIDEAKGIFFSPAGPMEETLIFEPCFSLRILSIFKVVVPASSGQE